MPEAILTVLRALVDAAFRSGAITDLAHTELHQHISEADPAVQDAPAPALTDAERAQLDELTAKQAAADAATAEPAGATSE